MKLLRQYVDRYEQLYVHHRPKRQYIFRNLTVHSLTPNTTHLAVLSREEELKEIYYKQIGLRR